MPKVAIEDTLHQIRDYLSQNGYHVVDLNPKKIKHVDAVVISGQDKDVLGIQDITTSAPVINAKGLTAEEVYKQLSERI